LAWTVLPPILGFLTFRETDLWVDRDDATPGFARGDRESESPPRHARLTDAE
jgi:hypothetical protein